MAAPPPPYTPSDQFGQPKGYGFQPPPPAQPGFPHAGYPQPAYPQPAHPQPAYPQPAYPQPGYAQPAYPPPMMSQPIIMQQAPAPQQQMSNNITVVNAGQPSTQTVIVRKNEVNHCLHFIIFLFFPPWIFVWICFCLMAD